MQTGFSSPPRGLGGRGQGQEHLHGAGQGWCRQLRKRQGRRAVRKAERSVEEEVVFGWI